MARDRGWGKTCTKRYVLARQQVSTAQLDAATDAYHRSLAPSLKPVFGSKWMAFTNEVGAQQQMVSVWQSGKGAKLINLLTYTSGTKMLMITACEMK